MPQSNQSPKSSEVLAEMTSARPVIFVHATGRPTPAGDWLAGVSKLSSTLYSHTAHQRFKETRNGIENLGDLLAELIGAHPGQPVLLLRAGVQVNTQLLDQFSQAASDMPGVVAMTAMSNGDLDLNPFAGCSVPEPASMQDWSALVSLLGTGRRFSVDHFPLHLAWLTADAAAALAQPGLTPNSAPARLRSLDSSVAANDRLFAHDTTCSLDNERHLEPHESRQPPPFGSLAERIDNWLQSGARLEATEPSAAPATLHVTHSWGGGVALWIESFINADSSAPHFQLRAEGPQSGSGSGQRLALYAGNETRCPVASWWLHPVIGSCADFHPQYREILNFITRRYGIGRVLVSSLVGQSLEALRTGLPTAQVLHDLFPAWPMLSVDPGPYLRENSPPDLVRALEEHARMREFSDRDSAGWAQLRQAWCDALAAHDVQLAAPSQSVADLLPKVAPHCERPPEVIPHGTPPLPKAKPVQAGTGEDGKLRLLVPGRIQPVKGQRLLLEALSKLTEVANVTLLGSGKHGEAFLGQSGIDVIPQFERNELAGLVDEIAPHAALLLSVVPETFSYTLSEMQTLGVPVIATHLGSLAERVDDGKTGWLIEPTAAALVARVTKLHQDPGTIAKARKALARVEQRPMKDMVAAYNAMLPAAETIQPQPVLIGADPEGPEAFGAMTARRRARRAAEEAKSLKTVAARRTEWAQETEKRLRAEQDRRRKWVDRLEGELTDTRQERDQWVEKLEGELSDTKEERDRWVGELKTDLAKTEKERDRWVGELKSELAKTEKERDRWVGKLTADLEEAHTATTAFKDQADYERGEATLAKKEAAEQRDAAHEARSERDQARMAHEHASREREDALSALRSLTAEHESVLQSHSWRLTRPLRVARRVASKVTQTQAWNPLKWPKLGSQFVRNVRTLGFRNAVYRLQFFAPAGPPPEPALPAEDSVGSLQAPLGLQSAEFPLVSIVIPVYNKWEYTAACLRSLLETSCDVPFEVIVVDDQSSDETEQRLAEMDGISIVRNEQNQGFIGSCNRGAAAAGGEILVLLNNDTQVTDHWLDHLVETLQNEPQAGLVGARLVFPDGSLQEAGGIIFNDATGWNYGRLGDSDAPQYHYLREVDYCSGACIAINTKRFLGMGGFDTHYAPAYYEDTDLAFRIREDGLKVLVNPRSVVVHHEGISSGTDLNSGAKRFQLVNEKKFLERWSERLAAQPEPIRDPDDVGAVRRARDHRLKGRVLVIDAYTPEPDQDSGSVRLTALMQCLRELGYGVTFFPDNRAYAGRYTESLQDRGIECWYGDWLSPLDQWFEQHGEEFEFVFISRHYIASKYVSSLRKYCPKARFIFDTVDLHYLREQRLAELEDSASLARTAAKTRESELAVIEDSDAVLVVSRAELPVLAEDAPGANAHVISNIHDVDGRREGFDQRQDVFFVGGFQHPPNIDAVEWFVREIWPLVREQLPEINFHIVGSKAPETIRELAGDGVVFHGFVENLDPFLDGCRLAVAPLRYGAGVKGKVNMSMSRGQPVVATPAAVEGMHAENGREVLIAGTEAEFAAEVVRIYTDKELWLGVSDAAVENVRQHFSSDAAKQAIEGLLDSLEA